MSTNTLTFDEEIPRRPTIDDCGGGGKVNAAKSPDPATMLTAEDVNQLSKQAVATGKMIPIARLFVTFPGGVPTISGVMAPGSNVDTTDFTPTDNGNGDTTIEWPTSLLPPRAGGGGPVISQIDDVEIDRIRASYVTSVLGVPGVRCKTKLGATGTDAAFVVEIY